MINPKIAIIILNYNGLKDTLECLASVLAINYSNYQVVLVDNSSGNGTVAAVRKKFGSRVKILANRQNLGFAEGNNVGIRWAQKSGADFVLLLNNDTLVNPNFLDILVKNVHTHPDFSVFGPQIRKYPQKNVIWYAGGRMFWSVASVQMFDRNQKMSQIKLKKSTKVSFIPGAAILIKTDVFAKVGILDKKFFLYWEETDWEARALRAGIKFLYVPDAVIWHKVAATSGGSKNPRMQYYFYRNNLLFAQKNLPFYWWPSFILFFVGRLIFVEFLLGLAEKIIGRPQRWCGLSYIWQGILDFRRGKFGQRKFD